MALIISSKGKDFATWRAAENFALTCRQVLLDKTALLSSDQAEQLFLDAERDLQEREKAHRDSLERLQALTREAAAAGDPDRLKELVETFYGECYDFFDQNHSAAAFYQVSQLFLQSACGTLIRYAQSAVPLTAPVALSALGPAGRHEYSPFCHLHLLLVHGSGTPADEKALPEFCRVLQEALERAGLSPDTEITPLNSAWRGTPAEWLQRLERSAEGSYQDFLSLARLVDQSPLCDDQGLAAALQEECRTLLQHCHPFLATLVGRVMELSAGIGIMGGFRLERRGEKRGLFGLLDHALLPLSASVGTLSLVKRTPSEGTAQRIRALLEAGGIDVEMAERLLEAWHFLHELRLGSEARLMPVRDGQDACYIDVQACSEQERERLKEHLETVETLQRHVSIVFGGWEE